MRVILNTAKLMQDLEFELEAIKSIYGCDLKDDCIYIDTKIGVCAVSFSFPENYPQQVPKCFLKLPTIPYLTSDKIKEIERETLAFIQNELDSLFVQGQVVIFDWITFLKEYLVNYPPSNEVNREINMAIAEAPDIKLPDEYKEEECPIIYNSLNPIVVKKSVFVAHACRCDTIKQVEIAKRFILSCKKTANATHNIFAYRVLDNGVIRQDYDDDGETAAGKRLLNLLQLLDVNNCMIIVSRWYGGINLGPLRFKCINNCARDLLEQICFSK